LLPLPKSALFVHTGHGCFHLSSGFDVMCLMYKEHSGTTVLTDSYLSRVGGTGVGVLSEGEGCAPCLLAP
jgi:hypothetical protein